MPPQSSYERPFSPSLLHSSIYLTYLSLHPSLLYHSFINPFLGTTLPFIHPSLQTSLPLIITMAPRPGRRGYSLIHVLNAILLLVLAGIISFSSTAPSTAIRHVEEVTSIQAVETSHPKNPVPFGNNPQLGFGFSPSSDSSAPINGMSSQHKRAVPLDWSVEPLCTACEGLN